MSIDMKASVGGLSTVKGATIATPDEFADARTVTLERGVKRTIFYVHGGAFVVGSPSLYTLFAPQLADITDFNVFLASYTLSPDAVFPRAIDEIEQQYKSLTSTHDPQSIVLMGDSAGANLAAALLTRLHQQNKQVFL
jgi:acetyl esterase/lipase